MRNANQQDIDNIRNGQEPEWNVMYKTAIGNRFHRKTNVQVDSYLQNGMYLFESDCGELLKALHYEVLRSIEKKQGTPPKPKKPHVKGTKPFVYNPDNIKVGTKVKCRDGSVRVVTKIDKYSDGVCFDNERRASVFLSSGWDDSDRDDRHYNDIIYIYPEEKKQEPVVDVFEVWYSDNLLNCGYLTKEMLRIAFNAGKDSK